MKKNLIRAGGLLLLVLFFALVIMSYTGIYEYQVKKKTDLTTENIEKFEKDIKEGKDVEVKDYLYQQETRIWKDWKEGKDVEVKDYLEKEKDNSNAISKLTFNASKTVGNLFNKAMGLLFKSIEKQVTK